MVQGGDPDQVISGLAVTRGRGNRSRGTASHQRDLLLAEGDGDLLHDALYVPLVNAVPCHHRPDLAREQLGHGDVTARGRLRRRRNCAPARAMRAGDKAGSMIWRARAVHLHVPEENAPALHVRVAHVPDFGCQGIVRRFLREILRESSSAAKLGPLYPAYRRGYCMKSGPGALPFRRQASRHRKIQLPHRHQSHARAPSRASISCKCKVGTTEFRDNRTANPQTI